MFPGRTAAAWWKTSPEKPRAAVSCMRAWAISTRPNLTAPMTISAPGRMSWWVTRRFPGRCPRPGWRRRYENGDADLSIVFRASSRRHDRISNAAAWLEAGCLAVGSGAFVFPPERLADRAWDDVEARARALLAAVAPHRSGA